VLLIDEYLFPESWRFLALGLPAFLVVLGAVSLEQALTKRAIAPLAFLGDASYSLYLFHPIATAIVAVIWARLFGIAYPAGFICAAVVAAIAVSIFFHLFIERPITGWLSMGGSLDGLFRHKLKRRAVGERLLPQQHTTPVSRK
jgi:peptidoglycan/LPS O-acetylase OafA/YrhL